MTITDPEQERKRLTELYGQMSEDELSLVAQDASQLSELAQQILQLEFQRRGLDIQLDDSSRGYDVLELRELVTIRRFRDLSEALVAKASLQSAGIDRYLADENMARLNWAYSNALGNIRLRVNAEDAEAALEILGQEIPESFEVEGIGKYELPRCPECGSLDSGFDNFFARAALLSLYMITFPVPFSRRLRRCHSCCHEWCLFETK